MEPILIDHKCCHAGKSTVYMTAAGIQPSQILPVALVRLFSLYKREQRWHSGWLSDGCRQTKLKLPVASTLLLITVLISTSHSGREMGLRPHFHKHVMSGLHC